MYHLLRLAALLAGALVGARAFTRWPGDSHMCWLRDQLSDVVRTEDVGDTCPGVIAIENRGTSLGVVRRVEGKVVSGGNGRVLATRKGSRHRRPAGGCRTSYVREGHARPRSPSCFPRSLLANWWWS